MFQKIFIVDDDPIWTLCLTQMLNDAGQHDITTFTNGTDCIGQLFQNPTLVFLDYQMDGLDGLQVLQKLQVVRPDTAVVFCTASSEINLVVTALKNGSSDFLCKVNFRPEDVKSILKNLELAGTETGRIY